MNKKAISVIKYIILLAIGVVLLWIAFRKVDLPKMIADIKNANLFWVGLSVVTSLVAFTSRAIRWNLLIEPLGYKPKLSNTCASLMIGYLANLAVPRLGEVTRCGSLNQTENVPFDKLLGTVIFERIIDVLCLLTCIILVAVSEYERLGNFLNENIFDPMKSKVHSFINSPISIAIVLIIFLSLLIFLFKNKKSKGFISKFTVILKGIGDGMVSVKRMKKPFQFIFHTILIWAMYFMMSYLCFFALPATSQLSWHAGLFVLVVGGLGMSAPSPGGVGSYHVLVAAGLYLYGISDQDGKTFATLMHASQTLVVIVFGALSFLYLFLKQKNGTANAS
ncbi:MAG: flippase-like domain-containing protein [Bacteroidetes bacterium]|nr:flippase-like domain-containing protein [Bacteroidota bacterium]MBP6427355.1 flippase-like domain-containing protein [Bacteroidia bacterium]MBK8364191.1 flippase-like domain-containing protein [Bacteroidota bacterium]MBK9415150.1 flippase-like domain-containing protein [Bacteroidota bacterium]MBL0031591.1 flippase-like domain-containing protein [Bacteroidota bacterium]